MIEAESVEEVPSDFDAEQVRVIVGKLNWGCLMSAIRNLKLPEVEVRVMIHMLLDIHTISSFLFSLF